jgi:hypothetical protein
MNTRKRFIAFAGCTTAFRRSAPIDLQGGFARRPVRGTATISPTTTRRADSSHETSLVVDAYN